MAVVFSGAYGPAPRGSTIRGGALSEPTPSTWRQHPPVLTLSELEAVKTGTQQALALTDLVNARAASRDLCKALLPTQFGRTFGPRALTTLLDGLAGRTMHPQGTTLQLRGENDGLYVILQGKVEVLSGPDQTRRLRVEIECGQGLPNGKVEDLLNKYCAIRQNAYVVVQVGAKRFRTPVVLAPAGADIAWNFIGHLPYDGESNVQFAVIECGFKSEAAIAVGSLPTETLFRGWRCGDPMETEDGDAVFRGYVELQEPNPAEEDSISGHKVDPWGGITRSSDGFALDVTQDRMHVRSRESAGTLKISVSVITEDSPLWQQEATMRTNSSKHATTTPVPPTTLKSPTNAENPKTHLLPTIPASPSSSPSSPGNNSIVASKSEERLEKELRRRPLGRVLGVGEYFGEKLGGAVRCMEQCQFLMVPRYHVARSLSLASEDDLRSRNEFLLQWLPGADSVDAKTFKAFSSSFHRKRFPKGYVFCSEGKNKKEEFRRVFLILSGEVRDLGETTAAPPHKEWEPRSRANCCNSEAGEARLARRLGKGAILGFHSALFGVAEPRTVVALTNVEAWVIDTAALPSSKWPASVMNNLGMYLDRRKANLPNVSERSRRRQTHLRGSLGNSASLPDLTSGVQRRNLAATLKSLRPPKPLKHQPLVSESWQYVTGFCGFE